MRLMLQYLRARGKCALIEKKSSEELFSIRDIQEDVLFRDILRRYVPYNYVKNERIQRNRGGID